MLLEAIAPEVTAAHRVAGGAHVRLVNRVVLHGEPLDFRELARRSIPEHTRYVVFDLDRTFHLDRNIGELLGWELCAAQGYGDAHLAALDATRTSSRFVLDWSNPRALMRYMLGSARTWAIPGLFYFVWGKLAHKTGITRRLRFQRFGTEPVRAVQGIPQTALLHQLAGEPLERIRRLARAVWRRYAGDQVIDAGDIAWLRERCPGVRIIIASASPQPVLDVAKEELGVDDVIGSVVEEHKGSFSAPFWLNRLLFPSGSPKRISAPSTVAINASHAKIGALLTRFPDIFDAGVMSVGVTDTGYGEDHCWAQHFRRVVDVNSNAPFSPIVPAEAPLEEIHSASPLTRRERDARAHGDAGFIDPRRKPRKYLATQDLNAATLEGLLGATRRRADELSHKRLERESLVASSVDKLRLETKAALASVERFVALYNDAVGDAKASLLSDLRGSLRGLESLVALRARVERPLAEASYALSTELERARTLLDGANLQGLTLQPA